MSSGAHTASPSDLKGLVHLAGHLALLVATGALVALTRGSLLILPALILHGIVLAFLFAPLHESLHRTAFRSRWLNDGVAWFAGLALLLPPGWFRAFHFAHHRHTQIEGADPELEAKRVETWPDYLVHLSGWRYWKGCVLLIIRHASRPHRRALCLTPAGAAPRRRGAHHARRLRSDRGAIVDLPDATLR